MTRADFLVDVSLPASRRAEDLVFQAYKDAGQIIHDRRNLRTFYDFEVWDWDGLVKLDVKYDRYIEQSRNVPFEKYHEPANFRDGQLRRGWGFNDQPRLLAVVGISLSRAWVYDMDQVRTFVINRTIGGDVPATWRLMHPFNVQGGYGTHGYAIPMAELSQDDVDPMVLELAPDQPTMPAVLRGWTA